MLLNNIVKNYWKSIAVIICILYLSFASPSTFKKIPTFTYEDKLVHLLMYAGLTFVLIFDFVQTAITNRKKLVFVLICLIFPIVLGGVVEIMQGMFFAPRSPSWIDWIANTIGVFLGWLSFKITHPLLRKLY